MSPKHGDIFAKKELRSTVWRVYFRPMAEFPYTLWRDSYVPHLVKRNAPTKKNAMEEEYFRVTGRNRISTSQVLLADAHLSNGCWRVEWIEDQSLGGSAAMECN